MDANIKNMRCLGKIMSICIKEHLSNIFEAQFINKLSNTEAELSV